MSEMREMCKSEPSGLSLDSSRSNSDERQALLDRPIQSWSVVDLFREAREFALRDDAQRANRQQTAATTSGEARPSEARQRGASIIADGHDGFTIYDGNNHSMNIRPDGSVTIDGKPYQAPKPKR